MLTRATRAPCGHLPGHGLGPRFGPEAGHRSVADGFRNPPNAARPRVVALDGRQHHEGRHKLDLEWLHRVGIGGVTLFDAALGGKQVVDKRLVY